jgi:hypothetical protein
VFNIDKDKQGKTELNFKNTLKLLNSILSHWNDSKIKGDENNYNKHLKKYNGYVIENKYIDDINEKYDINILDVLKNTETEGEEDEETNYINYCFHSDNEDCE